MDASNVIALCLGGASFLMGTGFGLAVINLAYHAGQARKELTVLSEALNGDGPWQRKIESTRAKADKAREYAEKVREEMQAAERARDEKCIESTRSLAAMQATLDTISRREARKQTEV